MLEELGIGIVLGECALENDIIRNVRNVITMMEGIINRIRFIVNFNI